MKRQTLQAVFSFILIGFFVSFACAEEGSLSSEEETVRKMDNLERTALVEGDFTTLEQLWHENYTVNNPRNFVNKNRNEVVHIVKARSIYYSHVDRKVEHVRLFGDTAIVMGSETAVSKNEAATPHAHRRFTHVWQKIDGSWRMIARHMNDIPKEPVIKY
jgi:Ketosteroid isomerase homolog